jgi:hypothetical protein
VDHHLGSGHGVEVGRGGLVLMGADPGTQHLVHLGVVAAHDPGEVGEVGGGGDDQGGTVATTSTCLLAATATRAQGEGPDEETHETDPPPSGVRHSDTLHKNRSYS